MLWVYSEVVNVFNFIYAFLQVCTNNIIINLDNNVLCVRACVRAHLCGDHVSSSYSGQSFEILAVVFA
jgi:hypothetical protein